MGLKEAICRDWVNWQDDGLENSTLTAKSARGVDDIEVENVKALQRALTKTAMARFANVIFDPNDVLIDIWDCREVGSTDVQTELGREVEPDDLIEFSDGRTWRIGNALYSHMTSRWSCRCHRVIEE